jgi:hypothetical protein
VSSQLSQLLVSYPRCLMTLGTMIFVIQLVTFKENMISFVAALGASSFRHGNSAGWAHATR